MMLLFINKSKHRDGPRAFYALNDGFIVLLDLCEVIYGRVNGVDGATVDWIWCSFRKGI